MQAVDKEMTYANPRSEILGEAMGMVNRDRNNTYGEPFDDLGRTAEIWNVIFCPLLKEGDRFRAHHVAMALAAVKLSRLTHDEHHRDSWTDLAGYAAIGYECCVSQEQP